jgi:hypothetical protein
MPVVHVAHGGQGASICVHTGLAVVPGIGCYRFWYTSSGNVRQFKDKSVLPGLPWDRCVQVEMLEQTDLIIILEDDQNTPVFVQFKTMSRSPLNMEKQVNTLQRFFRREVWRKIWQRNEIQKRLDVAALSLHPRVAAKSQITVDILFMVKKIFFASLSKKPSSH